jgi:hypothetical protein
VPAPLEISLGILTDAITLNWERRIRENMGTILLSLAVCLMLLLAMQVMRLKIAADRELKRRNLVRVKPQPSTFDVLPAEGYRGIEACTCERDGQRFVVIMVSRGWLRIEPFVSVTPVDSSNKKLRPLNPSSCLH